MTPREHDMLRALNAILDTTRGGLEDEEVRARVDQLAEAPLHHIDAQEPVEDGDVVARYDPEAHVWVGEHVPSKTLSQGETEAEARWAALSAAAMRCMIERDQARAEKVRATEELAHLRRIARAVEQDVVLPVIRRETWDKYLTEHGWRSDGHDWQHPRLCTWVFGYEYTKKPGQADIHDLRRILADIAATERRSPVMVLADLLAIEER